VANVKSVSASSTHALAVTQDGKLYGWGNAQFGNMGEQYYGDSATIGQTRLFNLGGVQAAAAGIPIRLVVMDNGDLWGYGGNEDGQLAVNTGTACGISPGIKIMDHVVAVNAVANWGEHAPPLPYKQTAVYGVGQ
jgi:alpha-tubulin suppressor-like RCC1 family protein